ncbi:regulator of telomere elongation helicase 1 homolog isoform X2 [Pseudomyrmex gracilis]|uniref:regulator of telomere elongation helicase 1 homolog isoform X2 n=1 Tax=Pseudomyrmex gracilis TaxID=219809 RepID=UPI0009956ED3|nr:regulator of telomere elongation helicase 1 homolog isoform X2 [Pseudomyrmex gracilis]
MPDITINDVLVSFPFKPYPVQEEYMRKVIECLQNSQHGVLESPTGTGKTLSLLCSSLSWLLTKKAQLQAQVITGAIDKKDLSGNFFKHLTSGLEKAAGVPDNVPSFGWAMPKIIYASRTHSQLSQAMHELKRTSYKHVATTVLGSRDQLCIHPEVSKETNAFNKIHMCHSKVKSRTCFYFNNVETRKDDPVFKQEILDIEDLVKVGQKQKCCPYFLAKELKQTADIIFMPYNYLLDPKTRKSQGIDLQNTVVLLDEAHNVEKVCEEAASLQISSTDVAMCIDEITAVMQDITKDEDLQNDFLSENTAQKDFTAEDLCILKAMFLELEKAIDSIELNNTEGDTFPGGFIFELLEKIELTHGKEQIVIDKLEKIILYLTTTSTSPFARKGNALQKFSDLLRTAFNSGASVARHKEKVKRCYKVHVQIEEQKKNYKTDVWENKKTTKTDGKLISYWCFSPGFGMEQMVDQGVRSVILTSGTLSPLKPFISELGIPIAIQLENPHIVTKEQVCVGILSQGPDNHSLNSSYNTRNDPKYIASLGRTVYNFCCVVPHGLLIFFPSYPIMKKCRDEWQNMGLWTQIAERKPIYVEPNSKDGFINVMNEYYQKIKDPSCKGAVFMAVCRGKVSEGLDFADANGRAVLIVGLPFPPLKDPRVMLKQRYLEEIKTVEKQSLSGQEWYQLEASRAVNQAIGRIIRHKDDYGAVILCDCRFENPNFKKQLSSWLRPYIKKFTNFGMITKELREFFKNAENTLPQPGVTHMHYGKNISLPAVGATFETTISHSVIQNAQNTSVTNETFKDGFSINMYLDVNTRDKQPMKPKSSVINFSTYKLKDNQSMCELAKHVDEPVVKKRKINIISSGIDSYFAGPSTSSSMVTENSSVNPTQNDKKENKDDKKALGKQYLKDVKRALSASDYKQFATMIQSYTQSGDYDKLLETLSSLFPPNGQLQHLFLGFQNFLKTQHIATFENYIRNLKRL